MVNRALKTMGFVCIVACSNYTSERSERDESIGNAETATYGFHAPGGLLHVREASEATLKVRAAAPDFEFQIRRKSQSVESVALEITNASPSLVLTSQAAVFENGQLQSSGTPVAGSTAFAWRVNFPAGTDLVTVKSEALAAQEFTFAAFGDIQNGLDKFDDVVRLVNEQADAEFVMLLGDLTSQAKKHEFVKVNEALSKIRVPVVVAMGNHDVFERHNHQNFFGRTNFSFVHRGVRFTSVDSSGFGLNEKSWETYKSWLEQGKHQTHIVFSHIAPTEPLGMRGGQWRSRREANMFLSRSAASNVDGFFFGHLHTLDIFHLAGIATYISGGAGAFEEKLDGIGRHFLKAKVNPFSESLSVEVIKVDK